MHSETKQPRFQYYLQNKFLYLLVSLLLLVALSPYSVDHERPSIIGILLFTAILFSGIWAVSREKYQTTIAVILALPMLVTLWLTYIVDDKTLTLATDFFSIAFLLYTMILILRFIFKEPKVTIDFSFVTLTTLGYGDVSPIGAATKSFAILEAVIGQMYIAVLMARLMGVYSAQMAYKKE